MIAMEIFIRNLAGLFDDTDPKEITADAEFKSLDEWSSLLALSIVAMVDEEYGVVLKGDDIVVALTVADLFRMVQNKL